MHIKTHLLIRVCIDCKQYEEYYVFGYVFNYYSSWEDMDFFYEIPLEQIIA